jgi:hypothetical protein
MKMTAIAAFGVCSLMAGCCNLPTSNSAPLGGISRDKVAPKINDLVKNIDWSKREGGASCDNPANRVSIQPAWAEITVTQMEQITTEGTPTISATLGVFSPSIGADIKDAHSGQTDTVIEVDKLDTLPVVAYDPKAPDNDKMLLAAHQISNLLVSAEKGISVGNLPKPCLFLNTITVTTVVDLIETANGEIKLGIGPVSLADLKASAAKESKVTLKIEVHFTGTPLSKGTLTPLDVNPVVK